MRKFDSIVIGTGTAGSYLIGRLAKAGQHVAAIERKMLGGTCINFGCTPTKALVASAYAAHLARRASEYGVVIETPAGLSRRGQCRGRRRYPIYA
jgi:pyruvate/2-oxoglutarate dehydrogenase complex dihydrolipoamide dehydrogenase (E3) component